MVKILLTGGHAGSTGLATIEEIKKRLPNSKVFWVGSKSVFFGTKATSLEYKIYPSMGIGSYFIHSGKLQTKFTRYTLPLILMIPVGFIEALYFLIKIHPKVTLSFGGYSAFPVVFWSWVLGIPVVIHEQTVAAGRSSMASSFFARVVAISRPESYKYFDSKKAVLTGNPLSDEIKHVSIKKTLAAKKTILVFGGSRGSEFINEEIAKILPKLTSKYRVIHITGERDYFKYKDTASENYNVLEFVNPRQMADLYKTADLVISRSGANTVSEIIYVKRPSILIPLPKTFMNEQYKNAEYAKEFGVAEILTEEEVSSGKLLPLIENMFSRWTKIVSSIESKPSPDENASKKLVDLLSETLP